MRKKYVRKQTIEHRLQRLLKGNCPVHGITMYQIFSTFWDNGDYAVECPRKDCGIKGFQEVPFGSTRLCLMFKYLLEKDFA